MESPPDMLLHTSTKYCSKLRDSRVSRMIGCGKSAGASQRKPPKATTKPYTRHILSIDSGVQRHLKATLKPSSCDPKATPRLHQGSTKAPPRPPKPGPKPKSEIRDPKEIRKPKAERSFSRWAGGLLARFRVRISDFGLPSVFGFRSSGFRPGSRFQASTNRAPKQPAKSPQSYPKAWREAGSRG